MVFTADPASERGYTSSHGISCAIDGGRRVELHGSWPSTPSVEAPQAQGLDESLSPEGPGSNSRGSRTTLLGNAILESLPARYRQVLELRVMEGRSIRDTADEMGTSPGNVKVLQHRALKKALAIADELDVSPRPMSAGAQRVLRSEA